MSGERLDAAARASDRDTARNDRAMDRRTIRARADAITGGASAVPPCDPVDSRAAQSIVAQLEQLTLAVCNLAQALDGRP